MDLSLFFAGTSAAVPSARRGMPAVLVRRGGERLLIDCGEGTQRQLVRSVGLADLDDIFITHLHLDHWLGLPGMVKSFALRDRDRPLRVFGPAGLRELMRTLAPVIGRLPYPLSVRELEPTEAVPYEDYVMAAVPVRHGTAAYGYALVEDARPGRFDAELAERLGVTPGPDFGRLQRGEVVDGVRPEQVIGSAREGRKIVISGDTAPCEAVAVAAHAADVLVHEATFTSEEAERARQRGHSTALAAATLARDAGVRLLALTHVSTRYAGGELREEARSVFAATEVPRDFDTIEVPFPERGGPELVRWSGAPRPEPAAEVAPARGG
ncbi:MAG TPA: ribonuclease Z [Solirubrobacteraceae bacterium]|jgi:ribonuclease Z|nr:ribonuclease Z [Solirubrobacteraceae bacterium]